MVSSWFALVDSPASLGRLTVLLAPARADDHRAGRGVQQIGGDRAEQHPAQRPVAARAYDQQPIPRSASRRSAWAGSPTTSALDARSDSGTIALPRSSSCRPPLVQDVRVALVAQAESGRGRETARSRGQRPRAAHGRRAPGPARSPGRARAPTPASRRRRRRRCARDPARGARSRAAPARPDTGRHATASGPCCRAAARRRRRGARPPRRAAAPDRVRRRRSDHAPATRQPRPRAAARRLPAPRRATAPRRPAAHARNDE
jgi:hypothetical protein